MKYKIAIALCLFERWLYLLFKGMWRGECGLTTWNEAGEIIFIATTTGSLLSTDANIKKVFYDAREDWKINVL